MVTENANGSVAIRENLPLLIIHLDLSVADTE